MPFSGKILREYPANCGTYSYDVIFKTLSKVDLFLFFHTYFELNYFNEYVIYRKKTHTHTHTHTHIVEKYIRPCKTKG